MASTTPTPALTTAVLTAQAPAPANHAPTANAGLPQGGALGVVGQSAKNDAAAAAQATGAAQGIQGFQATMFSGMPQGLDNDFALQNDTFLTLTDGEGLTDWPADGVDVDVDVGFLPAAQVNRRRGIRTHSPRNPSSH